MSRAIILAAVTVFAVGVGAALLAGHEGDEPAPAAAGGRSEAISSTTDATPPVERGLKVRSGSRKEVGAFPLRDGREVHLRTLSTTDGKSCLVQEEPSGAAGFSCLDGGLFAGRKVVWVVNFDGGPGRFSDMYLYGVAAPEVTRVSVERTDGSMVDVEPNADGGFVVESSPRDLELSVFPSGIRLYARGGASLGAIEIPAPG